MLFGEPLTRNAKRNNTNLLSKNLIGEEMKAPRRNDDGYLYN
jgi:hypothetical protein